MNRQAGLIAAVSTTVLIIAFDVAIAILALTLTPTPWTGIEAHAAAYNPLPLWLTIVPSLLLAPSFLGLAACLHEEAAPQHRLLTRMGLAAAAVYTALVALNYTIQLTVVRSGLVSGETDGLALWTMGNPQSIFWALEVVGYGFMSLAGCFLAPALGPVRVRRALYVNALIQVPATLAYFITVNPYHPLVIISLGAWGLLFPIATGSLAFRYYDSTRRIR
ncbi:MAG TPA: hypothetical protein VD969_20130 [Symbiobacteriaceae bacterium]|nr:hypothetical protein [Symbiobacteriaceae bacterium]